MINLQEKVNEVIDGKIDWRGRPARRGKHGGVNTCWFILGTPNQKLRSYN